MILILLIIILLVATFFIIKVTKKGQSKNGTSKKSANSQTRNKALLETAKKRLSANPHDAQAIQTLALTSYKKGEYLEASNYYSALIALIKDMPQLETEEIDLYAARTNLGLAFLELKKYDKASSALTAAFNTRKEFNADLLAGLGKSEYYLQRYGKALQYLLAVYKVHPDHSEIKRFLGLSYFKIHNFQEAIKFLRPILPANAKDKEIVFALASAYHELNRSELALKLFLQLMKDPAYGSLAALYSGTIYSNTKQLDEAIKTFKSGLEQPQAARGELLLELKYRLAQVYLKKENLEQALDLLKEIKSVNPSFKSVSRDVEHYNELLSNKNLNIYLRGSIQEFIVVCRNCLPHLFPKAKLKVNSIDTESTDYIDINVYVKAQRWEDTLLCRFYRGDDIQISEHKIRKIYTILNSTSQIGRAYCIAAGTFTPAAKDFVEARLIDLIDKQALLPILSKIKAV